MIGLHCLNCHGNVPWRFLHLGYGCIIALKATSIGDRLLYLPYIALRFSLQRLPDSRWNSILSLQYWFSKVTQKMACYWLKKSYSTDSWTQRIMAQHDNLGGLATFSGEFIIHQGLNNVLETYRRNIINWWLIYKPQYLFSLQKAGWHRGPLILN